MLLAYRCAAGEWQSLNLNPRVPSVQAHDLFAERICFVRRLLNALIGPEGVEGGCWIFIWGLLCFLITNLVRIYTWSFFF